MVMLSSITEKAIVDNLHKRYKDDTIYTYIGPVLISVNPFKGIKDLYSDTRLRAYRGKYMYELAPHVFALADAAYRAMLSEGENQCVIISGESGAGKTEASKKIFQYIASVCSATNEVARVRDIILQSNPLLEAFGNAKTVRNNNSSRFGKYMEIMFTYGGDPAGGSINVYLLEKSRVVSQQAGERNFHAFYQLLAGADAAMREEFGLARPEDFYYLAQSGCTTVSGMNDTREYAEVVEAMTTMGLTPDDQMGVWRTVAGILQLGNISFYEDDKEQAQPQDMVAIEYAAYLLCTSNEAVIAALTTRTIETGAGSRGSTYNVPNNAEMAVYARDALAKALYSNLFDWIVAAVNVNLQFSDPDTLVLGVLDIYGFEIFENNGFEQLCINYVNEKLQQIFIELTLKQEQEEYAAEGIEWTEITFFNNKIVCDLIESKRNPIGVFSLLNDVCNFPKGTDDKFAEKLSSEHSGHPHYAPAGHGYFTISHYAGDVTYCATGFCDRNKDPLFKDLEILCQNSQSPFIANLFPTTRSRNDKRRPPTSGTIIKSSIAALVERLMACTPHYIRCLKPNNNKKANDWDSNLSRHQVQYLGLLENVRIRRAGYAYRQTFDRFFYRYRVICSQTFPSFSGNHQDGASAILASQGLRQGTDFEFGRTKIFIRAPEAVFALEEQRDRRLDTYANTIQRFFLRFAMRQYYHDLHAVANATFVGNKQRRRNSVERFFATDYAGFRSNHGLKSIVAEHGRETLRFAAPIIKYDRRSRAQRRVLVVTDQATYIIAVEKNKNKADPMLASKPFVYICKRRITKDTLKRVSLSPLADNIVVLHVPGQHDNVIECRRKTELVAVLKQDYGVDVAFAMQVTYTLKKNKTRALTFVQDPSGGPGLVKKTKVLVAPGLDKSTPGNEGPSVISIGARTPARETVTALYDYDAQEAGELSFREGDVITIVSKGDGWWTGELRGSKGEFPSNYVQ
ncbi:myosin ID heavy chain [Thecamonas trahens ATCC 50062]|uniref:Myosin ID heavy chain n=1 Tax=Thecamonas trahens ATCC 50062 TaxID=461836 RepID=A0A0L0D5W0_THETB|nr:myosin ID heavy chain [Thecamonas trahens ATCC 50062]KNC47565.1 myosin ID heavy chain [Thecamonas trahens ATCC 50062]|eukprot:XP_013759497.1 myosin ID heavy chain [Thecamonas trahens ATCC 50062]